MSLIVHDESEEGEKCLEDEPREVVRTVGEDQVSDQQLSEHEQ